MSARHSHSTDSAATAGFLPLLVGGSAAAAFYALLPYVPVQRELLKRYFCSHPLEYVTTLLFFVGGAILLLKWLGLGRETAAFDSNILAGLPTDVGDGSAQATRIEERLSQLPKRLGGSYLVKRLRDVCRYIQVRKSADGLEDHLRHLADQSADRVHDSYGLVRTINWAVPILGFLGTVIGITLAIANVTPDQLNSSLNAVTGGLAVAFDTTALSLALSLMLVFGSFVVERAEQRVLVQVEDFATLEVTPLFPSSVKTGSPLLDAERHAAAALVEQTEQLINRQSREWEASLESLRERWTGTLAHQQQQFDSALQDGMAATLADHRQQLQESREQFAEACGGVAGQLQQAVVTFSEAVIGWQSQLQTVTTQQQQQLAELRENKDVLLKIVGEEENLNRLQDRLAENLQALRAAETFEETVHSLSAAVHLMTARVRPAETRRAA